jgi:hypothetical protein
VAKPGGELFRTTQTNVLRFCGCRTLAAGEGAVFEVVLLQRWLNALNEVEKTLTAGLDLCAVLSVIRGPVTLRFDVVTLVKQCVEGFEYQCFIEFAFSTQPVV